MTPEIVKMVFIKIIKRKDNSLWFIACNQKIEDIKINSLLPEWLDAPADDSGSIKLDNRILKYDNVFHGGENNGWYYFFTQTDKR